MHILTQKDHKEKEVGEEESNESLGLMLGSAFGRKCHAVEKKVICRRQVQVKIRCMQEFHLYT